MSDMADRILVVDDEPGMREGCRMVLESEGYRVETAEDGFAALHIFQRIRPFAAALIDLKMPRMDGMQLIQEIRRLDDDIVLFVITAYATIGTAVEAVKKGAYGYIPKPFTPEELLFALSKGLEKRALSLEAKRLREERDRRLLELDFERSRCRTILDCSTDGVLAVNRDRQILLHNAAAALIVPGLTGTALPAPIDETVHEDQLSTLVADALASTVDGAILSREISLGGRICVINAGCIAEPSGESRGAVLILRDITGSGTALAAGPTGRFDISRVPLHLPDLLRDTVETFRAKALEKRIDLSVEPGPADARRALADRDAMATVLGSLADKAIRHTPPGGHVGIGVEYDRVHAHVTFRDDGPCMTAEEKEKIFEEISDAGNRQSSDALGTEPSLAIVKRLMEMHNGFITVESDPDRGTVVCVSLPLAEERSDERS